MDRPLKPEQEMGALFLSRWSPRSFQGRRCLFADMGTGKTAIASRLAQLLQAKRILILCKDSGTNVWRYDGRRWLEQFYGQAPTMHFLDEEPWNREVEWNAPTDDNVHVFVCVYNTFANDMGVLSKQGSKEKIQHRIKTRGDVVKLRLKKTCKFDLVIADECRRLTDRKSAAFLALSKLRKEHGFNYFLPMSGTPGEWPPDYWTYFNLIDRRKFSSYWQFTQHFMVVDEGPFGSEILEQRRDTKAEWDRLLNEYCYIIAPGSMKPPVERQLIIYDLTPDQQKLYNDLQAEMMAVSGDDLVFAQNAMVQFLRLRQILICPKILVPSASAGGAIKHLVDLIQDYPREPTVIFTPFTSAFPHFTEYLSSRGFKDVFWLHGGISSTQQHDRITAYRESKGIVICTVKYAEAFSLEPARRSWFIGYDEDPQTNRQAENRLSRLTSAGDIQANYLTANTKNDLRMNEIVCIKQEHINFSQPSSIKEYLCPTSSSSSSPQSPSLASSESLGRSDIPDQNVTKR